MGMLENLKDVFSIIRKVDNIDLYKKLLDIQKEATEITSENKILREEIEEIKKNEQISKGLIFTDNLYWNQKESGLEGPYCTKCWDANRKLIRAHEEDSDFYKCPVCNTVANNNSDKCEVMYKKS